jgi:hypothetical protein
MVAVLALMETPAIIVGLLLARRATGASPVGNAGLLHDTLLNGSVVLLIGSFMIGMLIGTTVSRRSPSKLNWLILAIERRATSAAA